MAHTEAPIWFQHYVEQENLKYANLQAQLKEVKSDIEKCTKKEIEKLKKDLVNFKIEQKKIFKEFKQNQDKRIEKVEQLGNSICQSLENHLTVYKKDKQEVDQGFKAVKNSIIQHKKEIGNLCKEEGNLIRLEMSENLSELSGNIEKVDNFTKVEVKRVKEQVSEACTRIDSLENFRDFVEVFGGPQVSPDLGSKMKELIDERVKASQLTVTTNNDDQVLKDQIEELRQELASTKEEIEKTIHPKVITFNTDNISEGFCIGNGYNLSKSFPKFQAEGNVHPTHFLRVFSRSLPSNWKDNQKIDFAMGYLVGEALEWASAHAEEFDSWEDFKVKFKERYWSSHAQEKLKMELLDPKYFNNSWGSIKKYFEWHFTRSKLLDNPVEEEYLAKVLVRRLPYNVQREIWCHGWKTVKELLLCVEGLDNLTKPKTEMPRNNFNEFPPKNQSKGGEQNKNNFVCNLQKSQFVRKKKGKDNIYKEQGQSEIPSVNKEDNSHILNFKGQQEPSKGNERFPGTGVEIQENRMSI